MERRNSYLPRYRSIQSLAQNQFRNYDLNIRSELVLLIEKIKSIYVIKGYDMDEFYFMIEEEYSLCTKFTWKNNLLAWLALLKDY